MEEIKKSKEQNKQTCKNILKKKDELDMNDLNKVEDIIAKDNTEPEFIITYLKILKKLNKEETFKTQIKKYEYFISKETLDKEFPGLFEKKLSSKILFKNLYKHIIAYKEIFDSNEKYSFFKKFFSILPEFNENDVKGFTDYNLNKELSLYILAQKIKNGILNHIKNIKEYEDKEEEEENPWIKSDREMLREAEAIKRVQNYEEKKTTECPSIQDRQIYEKRKLHLPKNIDEVIKNYKEEIILLSKIETKNFAEYMEKLSNFLINAKKNFDERFKDLENLEIKEYKLLRDFCFFIEHDNLNFLRFYMYKWIDTLAFGQSEEYIKEIFQKNNVPDLIEYKIKDNVLNLTLVNNITKIIKEVEIKNIDKYSINSVVSYLHNEYVKLLTDKTKKNKDIKYVTINKTVNEYDIENLLRFDKVQEIFIYKKWNIIEDHLIKIFTSPVIQQTLEKICKRIGFSDYYDFLKENELRQLFKRSGIFLFQTDFLGITDHLFFMDYIYYKGKIDDFPEEYCKLFNICFYQITQEQEILGPLNLRLQNYLSKEKMVESSSIIDKKDSSGNIIKEPELDDVIEELMYGRSIIKLHPNEILFLLDIDNYQVNLDMFKNNFNKCRKTPYTISKNLSEFLKSLNIEIKKEFKNDEEITMNNKLILKRKFDDNNYQFYRQQNHAEYLHPPKLSESSKKFIDKMREEYFGSFNEKNN